MMEWKNINTKLEMKKSPSFGYMSRYYQKPCTNVISLTACTPQQNMQE